MVKKKGKRETKQQHFLESNVSEQRDKGWTHVIRVQDTTHLAVTTTQQGNRRSQTTPHRERMSGLVKHRDYHPHSYIVNERYNSQNKRASQEKKKSEWQEPVTNPCLLYTSPSPRDEESSRMPSSA